MPKFVIERDISGIGGSSAPDLQALSQASCAVLRVLDGDVQWIHSYVTDEKFYCVYQAPSEERIREHARLGGFPANSVAQVRSIIDPATAEA